MADVISQEEYDAIKDYYRKDKGYDDLSEDEKEEFDRKLDVALSEIYEVGENDGDNDSDETETSDYGEKANGSDKITLTESQLSDIKNRVRKDNGYDDMSDDEKEAFDEKLDQICSESYEVVEDENENDKAEENENSYVKKLVR